jgi:hypothetical protein
MYSKIRYQILNPVSTHFRPATCEEVDCAGYLHGWQSTIDESTDLGQRQADYIRRRSGRSYTEDRSPAGLTVFTFSPGQSCFRSGEHKTNLGLEPAFVVDAGDRRYRHSSGDSWADDLRTHTEAILGEINKG